jgi:hypothetical protein
LSNRHERFSATGLTQCKIGDPSHVRAKQHDIFSGSLDHNVPEFAVTDNLKPAYQLRRPTYTSPAKQESGSPA